MSYPRSLDDYTLSELTAEIDRRFIAADGHKCPYCNRDEKAHTCKYAGREYEYYSNDDLHSWLQEF